MDNQTFASFLRVLQEVDAWNPRSNDVYLEAIRQINNGARIMDYVLVWCDLAKYVNLFAFEEIDLLALSYMHEYDLMDVGVDENDIPTLLIVGLYYNNARNAVPAQSG